MPIVEIVLEAGLHQQDRIERLLQHLLKGQGAIMATLDDVLADQAKEQTDLGALATAVTSLKTGFAQLQKELADALAGQTIPADVQAKIDQVFENAESSVASVDATLAAAIGDPVPDQGGAPQS
jgi:hypothetical protein